MDNIILWIMAIAMVLGALDRMFGSRLGLGKQFEEGILAIGALSLSMLGILTLAPVLARLLRPVLVPVYGFLGADPAMFAGSILANDMGGAPLAMELAGILEDVRDFRPKPVRVVLPDREKACFYEQKYERYLDCYHRMNRPL